MQQAIFVLNNENSIANQFFAELRHRETQQHRMQFRRNLVKLGGILAYEISKCLDYQSINVETVLGISSVNVLQHPPVLFTIIRAGLPFLEGFQECFNQSDCGFVGASRSEGKTHEISITMGYQAIAPFEGKDLIIVDPMLATGKSLAACTNAILEYGTPKSLHFAIAIASPEGAAFLKESLPMDHQLWIGAMDDGLNQKGYIVPGLGDAGDLLFGGKIE
ncbi:MAG: uracil phosphoribosyltransferase [Cyclobacteriaceae bacterium]|nr:uracil phosphoribosyltransferase [Cyclobacteriaceae bacterium]